MRLRFTHDNASEIREESFTPHALPGSTRKPNLAGKVLVAEFSSDRYSCREEGGIWRVYDLQAGSVADSEHEFISQMHKTADQLTQTRAIKRLRSQADINRRHAEYYKK